MTAVIVMRYSFLFVCSDWCSSSPKWPIMCRAGHSLHSLTYSVIGVKIF